MEKEIINAFINSRTLSGEWYVEVPVGLERAKKEYFDYLKREGKRPTLAVNQGIRMSQGILRESIDAVCVQPSDFKVHPRYKVKHFMKRFINFDGKRVWLIEAKKRLDHKALGQLLNYQDLFREDWKVEVAGLGIVCKNGNVMLEVTCKNQGVKVWQVDLNSTTSKPLV